MNNILGNVKLTEKYKFGIHNEKIVHKYKSYYITKILACHSDFFIRKIKARVYREKEKDYELYRKKYLYDKFIMGGKKKDGKYDPVYEYIVMSGMFYNTIIKELKSLKNY